MQKNGAPSDTLPFINPATGERFGQTLMATPEDVARAYAEMRRHLPIWRAKSPQERVRIIKKLQYVLVEYAAEIAATINQDTGKSMHNSLVEVFAGADRLHTYCKHAPGWLKEKSIPRGLYPFRRYQTKPAPFGVVAIIGPWNLPLDLSLSPTIAALMAGNTVLLKPSELAPATGQMIEKLIHSVPEISPFVRVLHGDGSVGAAIVAAQPDLIFLTGSVETGRKIARAAAETMIPFIHELGGKDPMLVLADADLSAAAKWGAWGSFWISGHACNSIERIYAVAEIYEPFVAAFVEAARQQQIGYSPDKVTDFSLGPISSERQMAIIFDHLEDAVQKGAKIVIGGRRNGLFLEPTVLVDVDHTMKIMRAETFGPVVCIMKAKDEAEAIALANDSNYGLNAYVWGRDLRHAEAVADQLEVGAVLINDAMVHYLVPLLPFGGVKQSGNARTHCEQDVMQFSQTHSYAIGGPPHPLDISVSLRAPDSYHLLDATLHGVFGVTPAQRLAAVPALGRHLTKGRHKPDSKRLAVAAGKSTLIATAAAGALAVLTFGLLRTRKH